MVFAQKTISIIPKPLKMQEAKGEFKFDEKVKILAENNKSSKVFVEKLKKSTGVSLAYDKVRDNSTRYISVNITDTAKWCGEEGYHLNITESEINIIALTEAGAFYAFQTIRQLMPTDVEKENFIKISDISVPCVKISDKPRFLWRGMNFDCCRHFMEVDFVKRYIDLLAFHKMNKFHWHLTEDQGWRIEIKKYPKLTEISAWRIQDDGSVYGGYYTQEQIRDVVKYAEDRFITVIPEIEMPGHSVAALAAYPHLSCTGGPFQVEKRWGVFNDIYCAGNDSAFYFLQDVLLEVMDLFPSKYIHVGGDEAPKFRWEKCKKCQARMKSENLASEEELQSYFIRRMEKFLNSHGRYLIGWDEILEGGLAPSATVQSWRGMEGGIEAALSGHDAIMSPVTHCYFDYSITNTNFERVYSFEPIPEDLPKDKHKHILGGECCMWTEVAPQETIDSRMFPRLCALCEVLWSSPANRSFSEFKNRMKTHYDRLDNLNISYGYERDPIKLTVNYDSAKDLFIGVVEHGQPDLTMYYTVDGSTPTKNSNLYSNPVEMKNSTTLKVAAIRKGAGEISVEQRSVARHLALGKKYTLKNKYSKKYVAGGDCNLTNGLRGTLSYGDSLWQGYEGVDFEAVIDMGKKTKISEVGAGFLQCTGAWIFYPLKMEVYTSNDMNSWQKVGEVENKVPQTDAATTSQDLTVKFLKKKAKYVKIVASAMHQCPEWHSGAGGKTWLFLDEIIIK